MFVAVLGVAIAGGSAYATREYLNSASATAATDSGTALVTVVVAGRDIPFGQAIQPQMLQILLRSGNARRRYDAAKQARVEVSVRRAR